jgi:hypothetical protein
MTRPGRRRLVAAVVSAAAVAAIGLALSGAARGIALYAYVLLLVTAAVATLASRIRSTVPSTRPFEALLPREPERTARVVQLEGLVGALANGRPNAFDLHHRLRPLAREIAAARLARSHGVDLERRPERARELVGPRTWELIRPEREPPVDRLTREWSIQELGELVSELERM